MSGKRKMQGGLTPEIAATGQGATTIVDGKTVSIVRGGVEERLGAIAERGRKRIAQDKADFLQTAAPEMLAKLKRVVYWLDRMAAAEDANEKTYRGRFDSIADHCVRDAKNWRATAAAGRRIAWTVAVRKLR